jgi:quinol monooxygenase YgiN
LSPKVTTVVIIGHFRLPVENLEAARAPMARVVAATRSEPGCIKYSYALDPDDPGLVHVSEVWESQAALDAHFTSAHMKQWQEERAGLGLSDRQITGYTVSGSTIL